MEGLNFGWLAVWVLSPDWLCHKLEVCDVCQALRWSRRAGGRGLRAVLRLCIVYPGICLTTEKKSRKTLSQGNRRAFDWSAPNAMCLVLPGQYPWDMWWREWHWDKFSSEYFRFPPVSIIPPVLHTHSFIYHRFTITTEVCNVPRWRNLKNKLEQTSFYRMAVPDFMYEW